MEIKIYSEEQINLLKKFIDNKLDILQERLQYHKSSIINNVVLKDNYQLNSTMDGFIINTSIDSALVFLIQQAIELCIIKQVNN